MQWFFLEMSAFYHRARPLAEIHESIFSNISVLNIKNPHSAAKALGSRNVKMPAKIER
jgi:hypothetical protein